MRWIAPALCLGVLGAGVAAQAAAQPAASLDVSPSSTNIASASTFGSGSFVLTNDASAGGPAITGFTIDLASGPALFPDLVFDPDDEGPNDLDCPNDPGGDTVCRSFDVSAGTSSGVTAVGTHSGPRDGGFDRLHVTTTGLGPGNTLAFAIDIDPTSIKGSSGSAPAGPVSGAELHGATLTVDFSDGSSLSRDLVRTSDTASAASLTPGALTEVGLRRAACAPAPAAVAGAQQALVVTGPPGTSGVLLRAEGELDVTGLGAPFDPDPFEANTAVAFEEIPFSIGANGTADVSVTLTDAANGAATDTGLNYLTAHPTGVPGLVSAPVVLDLDPSTPADGTAPTLTASSPADGASGVPVGSSLVATFSEGIDPATLTAASVRLRRAAGGPAVAATLDQPACSRVVLDPAIDLEAGTDYELTIGSAVTDSAGNPIVPRTIRFTTTAGQSGPSGGSPPAGGAPAGGPGPGAASAESPQPSATVTRRCAGVPATIVGTPGADRLVGTTGRDVIVGLGGADVILGRGGNDLICPGGGADRVSAGPGADRVIASSGNDLIQGNGGRDILAGGPGADRITGGPGPDRIAGGAGKDRLRGGPGNDHIGAGPGTDLLVGDAGRDRLEGGPGTDRLYGNGGRDILLGQAGPRDLGVGGPAKDTCRTERRRSC